MDFITRFSAKLLSLAHQTALATLLLVAPYGHAGSIEPQKAVAQFIENRIEISSRFSITLSPLLEQALQNGLTLPFEFEFVLTRPRLYAWAYQISSGFASTETTTQRLAYQALTKQYRVSSGGLSRYFSSLNEALSALGIISGWRVLPDSDVAQDYKSFAGKIRLRLDLSQLPKPYQMTAIGQSEWHIDSPWITLSAEQASEATQP